jgi:hypothetical protein
MFVRKNSPAQALFFATLMLSAQLLSHEVFAQAPQAKPSDRVSGVVINSVTREPIARALVSSPDERFATLTDVSGHFEFTTAETPAEGQAASGAARSATSGSVSFNNRPYTLTARKPGFLNGDVGQGQMGQRVIEGKDVEIALVPEALVVGRVALPTSKPPDPIEVELYRREVRKGHAHWVSAGTQSTRSNGEFRFAELRAGSYKLLTHELREEDPKFSAPGGQVYGYAPVYYPNASGFASAGTIELTAGKIAEANLALVRQQYFPVIVPVTNVPSAKGFGVEVSVMGRGGPGYALAYDWQKQSIVGLLPNGSYRLQAVGYGEQPLSGEADITVHGGAEGTVLPLTAGSPLIVHVKDEFTSEVSPITNTTTGRDGQQITQQRSYDATVSLEPADDFGSQQRGVSQGGLDARTNSIHLGNVTPGRYWVQVDSTHGYAASVTAGSVDLLHHPLTIPPGSSVPSIEVTLRDDSATIDGVVEGASSLTGVAAPISLGGGGWGGPSSSDSSARVYFIPSPDGAGRFAENFVSQDGKFSMSLPPGDYRVLAFPQVQPDLEYNNPEALRPYDTKGQVVRLAAGQKEHIQLQLVSPSE